MTVYETEMKNLGDISSEKPEIQMWKNDLFDHQDQQSIFQPLPLVRYPLVGCHMHSTDTSVAALVCLS
jgi:hypothetical protein